MQKIFTTLFPRRNFLKKREVVAAESHSILRAVPTLPGDNDDNGDNDDDIYGDDDDNSDNVDDIWGADDDKCDNDDDIYGDDDDNSDNDDDIYGDDGHYRHVTIKSPNKYKYKYKYKSSNNKTVSTEIYKPPNKYLQIFQQ